MLHFENKSNDPSVLQPTYLGLTSMKLDLNNNMKTGISDNRNVNIYKLKLILLHHTALLEKH